jgi:hypothetical protein
MEHVKRNCLMFLEHKNIANDQMYQLKPMLHVLYVIENNKLRTKRFDNSRRQFTCSSFKCLKSITYYAVCGNFVAIEPAII